jgi:hypothetical protein
MPTNGAFEGGQLVTISSAPGFLSNGSDLTQVLLCGVRVPIVAQNYSTAVVRTPAWSAVGACSVSAVSEWFGNSTGTVIYTVNSRMCTAVNPERV